MARLSAGLLAFREHEQLEVFLVHPGGPYWTKRDLGAWSLPKGEVGANEDPYATAHREFREEVGFGISGAAIDLGEVRQKSGKRVRAWAIAANFDAADLVSNTFEMEWPPKSGQRQSFPEVDRGEWFALDDARRKILEAQATLLDRLRDALGDPLGPPGAHRP